MSGSLSSKYHKIGSNLNSKLPVASKTMVDGRVDGRKEGWMVKPGEGWLTAIKKLIFIEKVKFN